jgi:hypothetical protein
MAAVTRACHGRRREPVCRRHLGEDSSKTIEFVFNISKKCCNILRIFDKK